SFGSVDRDLQKPAEYPWLNPDFCCHPVPCRTYPARDDRETTWKYDSLPAAERPAPVPHHGWRFWLSWCRRLQSVQHFAAHTLLPHSRSLPGDLHHRNQYQYQVDLPVRDSKNARTANRT